jgi:nucleotide-binding universal stress UspA family protein
MSTTSRSRRTSAQVSGLPGTRPTRTPRGGVLVGIDTDQDPRTRFDEAAGRPLGALAWAVDEARASGRPLHLLTACAPLEPLAPGFGHLAAPYPEPGWDSAGPALQAVVEALPDPEARSATTRVTTERATGHAWEVLLEACPDAGMLVIGQRRLGAVRRWVEGSTSMAVVGRCPVPVAVVPDDWPSPGARDTADPVTVGVDLHPADLRTPADGQTGRHLRRRRVERAEAAVGFAAAYAARHGVALRVRCSWEPPPELAWSDDQLATHEARRAADLDSWVEGLSDRPTGLDVSVETSVGRAAERLVAYAASSSLTVVGRHSGLAHTPGRSFGSSTRALLRHAPSPVVVVPPTQL